MKGEQFIAIGSLTSGDLSKLRPPDISGLDKKTLEVHVEPGAQTTKVTFSTPTSLDAVASQIQTQVAAGVTAESSRQKFTCERDGGRLVLRSGIADAASAVTVTDGGADSPSNVLKLIVGATASEQFMAIGSLTSGDLLTLRPADISGLDNKTLEVLVEPGAQSATVTFSTPTSLDAVASQIQTQVTAGAPAESSRQKFTCKRDRGRLVLRSGTADAASAVAVTVGGVGSPSNVLKLVVGATAMKGEQALMAMFSNASTAVLSGGANGALPTIKEYGAPLQELRKLRDINIILLPGQAWSAPDAAAKDIIGLFRAHAEDMKNRMLIIDPAKQLTFTSQLSFLKEGFPTSTYTSTYYPWLEVANPHYHPELRPDRHRTVLVPPSGFAAGLWAKTDSRRGVWKAPAGLQSSLIGAASTAVKIGDDEQDQLNPVGVNCFRRIISDIVIWGSRTLATNADPEWRYIPVRRTAILLEESIYRGIQWAVFEPNDHRLWSSLRLSIGAFMDILFRAGAFQGEKASDAYFVRCGLGDTMTQAHIDAGQVIAIVGFAPLKPAEFVIVRIQQIVGKQ
jgi:phage tail sheath protein FI